MNIAIKPRARTDRPNTTLAAAVDQALTVADEYGTQAAARLLAEHGTSFTVICRVLAEPGRRRSLDLLPPRP